MHKSGDVERVLNPDRASEKVAGKVVAHPKHSVRIRREESAKPYSM